MYLVGAGPGDADLLTLRAARILAQADVVVYDRLVSKQILSLVNPAARLVCAGKRHGEQDAIQYAINQWLFESAKCGYTVVRLKSGDPMIFGRGGEELAFLAEHGIFAEVVPGISSAISFSSLTGIPLTYRGIASSFAVIAGHRQSLAAIDWGAHLAVDTLVVLMGVENRVRIAQSLISSGRNPDQLVAFVERLSTPEQRVIESTLKRVASNETPPIEAPAVFVISDTVRLRHLLHHQQEALAS